MPTTENHYPAADPDGSTYCWELKKSSAGDSGSFSGSGSHLIYGDHSL
jgi:hypothetical protein